MKKKEAAYIGVYRCPEPPEEPDGVVRVGGMRFRGNAPDRRPPRKARYP